MTTLTASQRAAVHTPTRFTATASDNLTYIPNTNQVLEIHNNTVGALTNVTIKGTAPSAAFPVTGAITMNLSSGYVIPSIAAGATVNVALDSIAPYLAGTGNVLVTAATGATVILLQG